MSSNQASNPDTKTSIPEMEVFRTEDFYVLMNSESSLWCNRKSGELEVKPGWELANSGDVECLGVFYGLVGKIDFQVDCESRLLLIKDIDEVGVLPDGRTVIKVKSVVALHPCGGELGSGELGLKSCKKHKGGGCGSGGMWEAPQRSGAALAKTWGTIKSATNSIKSTTQQAAALATYQVKGGPRKDAKDREKFEKRILEELQRVFTETDSFYFCLGPPGSRKCDLTNCLQKHYSNSPTDDRFFWNKYMLREIIEINSELAKAWILPIIQGYVQIEHCTIDVDPNSFGNFRSEGVTLAIVSRRSRHRAGTRYKRRGLDEEGNCANYVETEQVAATSGHELSFVQVRGSVPLFWSQPGYKYRPPPVIDKGEAETKAAFEKHMNGELKRYGPVCIVNLVEQCGKERVIWESFTQQVIQFNSEQVTYAVFDFHEHCRGMKFENVSLLISRLEEVIQEMGFCWRDRQGTICHQAGVFRVNCIDCLDRTNVVQTAIGKAVLETQLTKLGVLPPEGALPPSLRSKFQLLWANNGDIISKQYAGTNALKGDYTRTGERKFTGMMKDGMNSANRYLQWVTRDEVRQVCLEVCQGIPLPLCPPHVDLLRRDVADLLALKVYDYHPFEGGLRLGVAAFSLSRYYLSRFKDVYRQATIDIMQGHTVTEDSLEPDPESMMTAEHVKLLIEDCKRQLITDSSLVLGAWGLINADPITGDPTETDMDTILILTRDSYYVADYDEEVDKVTTCQRIPLSDIVSVELGQIEVVHPHSPLYIFHKTRGKPTIQTCLRLRYKYRTPDHIELEAIHVFRSAGLRFFNNVAIVIKSEDEMIESLRAICDSLRVALDVEGEREEVTWRVEPESLMEGGHQQSHQQGHIVKNMSEVQLESLKTVGSKAISNMTSKFSKLGSTLNPKNSVRARSAQSPSASHPPDLEVGGEAGACSGLQSESFLPRVGIVMSNAGIHDSIVDTSDVVITQEAGGSLSVTKPSELKLRTFSHSSGEVDEKERLEVRGEATGVPSLELALGITASQSENALRSLKTGFSSAAGQVLTSPSAVLSPLTRLAKGVLGGGGARGRSGQDLREAWEAAGCKSRLISV